MQIGRVAGGAIAEHWLKRQFGIEIVAWVSSVGTETMNDEEVDVNTISRAEVTNISRTNHHPLNSLFPKVDGCLPVRSGTMEAKDRFVRVIEAVSYFPYHHPHHQSLLVDSARKPMTPQEAL